MTDHPVIRTATAGDETDVIGLWEAACLLVPHNDPLADFRQALAWPTASILVAVDAGRVTGSVMLGADGHRGWLYYLAVAPDRRGTGLGRALVDAASEGLRALGMRKVQLLVRAGNEAVLSFYERVGFERSEVGVMQRWLVER